MSKKELDDTILGNVMIGNLISNCIDMKKIEYFKKDGNACLLVENGGANYQYKNAVYWKKIMLSDMGKKQLGPEYENVTAIYIMPYRITKQDVEKAVKSDTKPHPFNKKRFSTKNPFRDYDTTTGNFHKRTKEVQFQIVLVKRGGPGWKKIPDENFREAKDFETRKTYIKTNWYFPEIGDDNNNETLEELLTRAITTIFKDENTAIE